MEKEPLKDTDSQTDAAVSADEIEDAGGASAPDDSSDEKAPIQVYLVTDTENDSSGSGSERAASGEDATGTDDQLYEESASADTVQEAMFESADSADGTDTVRPMRPTVRHAAVARTQSNARAYTSTREAFVPHRVEEREDGSAPHRRSVRGEKVVRSQTESGSNTNDQDMRSDEPQPRRRPHVEAERAYSGKLTPKLIVELAAPHTWAASTMPVLLAISLCIADTSAISISTAIILLVICVLMQSAVNTINDYFDYVKGTDTVENQDDPTDAVLVYNDIDPKQARNLALAFLGAAFLLGIVMIVRAGWIPLVIALIGAVIVFLYSGGRTPISYLPIGEIVSGFTMGGLIPLACYQVLTLDFSWTVLVYSIPVMIGIALIMMTNNTCDIEKDIEAERKTLPTLLGRQTSVTVYRSLLVIWLVAIVLLIIIGYPRGWYGLFFLVAAYGPLKALFTNPFTTQTRGGGMAAITSTNAILGMGYAICLLMSVAAFPVL